jgi:hypothetical protein
MVDRGHDLSSRCSVTRGDAAVRMSIEALVQMSVE